MTETSLWQFRSLILDLRDNAAHGFGDEILLPGLEQHPEVVAELHEIGRPESHTRVIGRDEYVLEGLYALSRLTDILIAPHQPVNDDPAVLSWTSPGQPWWRGPLPSDTAWASFCATIGAAPIAEDAFHPFFHEIVAVTTAVDPDEPPALVGQVWPGALVGGLVLARAGVTVRAGVHILTRRWRRDRACTGPGGGATASPGTYRMAGATTRNGVPTFAATTSLAKNCTTTSTTPHRRRTTRPTATPTSHRRTSGICCGTGTA